MVWFHHFLRIFHNILKTIRSRDLRAPVRISFPQYVEVYAIFLANSSQLIILMESPKPHF